MSLAGAGVEHGKSMGFQGDRMMPFEYILQCYEFV